MKIAKIILIIVLLLLIFQVYKNMKIPNTVGVIDGNFKALKDSPNGISSQAKDPEFKVPPLTMKAANKNRDKDQIKNLVLSYEGTKLIAEKDRYLHFIFTSQIFHFNDDVEFYFDTRRGTIEIKSQSRIGHSDLGANRERYDKIAEDYGGMK